MRINVQELFDAIEENTQHEVEAGRWNPQKEAGVELVKEIIQVLQDEEIARLDEYGKEQAQRDAEKIASSSSDLGDKLFQGAVEILRNKYN